MRHWRSFRAVLLLPGVVTVGVPLLLLGRTGLSQLGRYGRQPWSAVLATIGVLLVGGGLWLLYQTVRLFATRGQGTLAPWEPPTALVVHGVYRRVRNPMISGVFAILLGEVCLFGSRPLLGWFLAFFAVNLTYIPLLEEPMLRQRFGERYALYREHVPRWLPRRHEWQPPWEQSDMRS
jgi:protein-S-isoprenylcysteine O-methyltransferase Ste14